MRHTDTQIRDRMFDIVVSIRPLSSDIQPSELFVRETRKSFLDHISTISLLMHRRTKTLASAEEATWKGHDVA